MDPSVQLVLPSMSRSRRCSTRATINIALWLILIQPACADPIDDCADAADPGDAITGCTAVINSDWATEHQLVLAFNNRANAQDYFGRSTLAIDDYSAALALEPHYVNARYNRAATYLDLKQWGLAIADFDAVLKLDPSLNFSRM